MTVLKGLICGLILLLRTDIKGVADLCLHPRRRRDAGRDG